jgi:hypothetical protein
LFILPEFHQDIRTVGAICARKTSTAPCNPYTICKDLVAYHFFTAFFCASALPAADFDAGAVRPSVNTLEADVAAAGDVDFFGALACESALPAALFELAPVLDAFSVFDAAAAALPPVVFAFAITVTPCKSTIQNRW